MAKTNREKAAEHAEKAEGLLKGSQVLKLAHLADAHATLALYYRDLPDSG